MKHLLKSICLALSTSLSLTGCSLPNTKKKLNIIDDKYRTAYQIFVYSFYDSNGDGIGDLKGIQEKLDYINDGNPDSEEDLALNQIWLTPISPSISYHKYDVIDYKGIDSEFGTMEDFDALLEECHKRGIQVILDLVMNHSSSKHPWFLEASNYLKTLKAGEEPDKSKCKYVDYYNFTKKAETGYAPLKGTEWFYEARFWEGMPDFNLDNPEVQAEFNDIFKFWLEKGIDGFRLDAVTSYYTGRPSKNKEILTWLNQSVKAIKPDAYIVGEAWTDVSEYGEYYGSGVDSFFDFEFSGSDGVIAKVLKGLLPASDYVKNQVKSEALFASKNKDYINAPFYTNHDIPRSAGYYSGEFRIEQIKLSGAMNLLMKGNAFIYYGEELGMKGSGKDENKRAPMQWFENIKEKGMCKGPKNMEEIKMLYGNLENQKMDKNSIYHYYKKAIKLRNTYPIIARGSTFEEEIFSSEKVTSFSRSLPDNKFEPLFISINTSGEEQSLTLPSDFPYQKLIDSLVTGEAEVSLKERTLLLPPFSIALLSK